jgi:hypothetical protein
VARLFVFGRRSIVGTRRWFATDDEGIWIGVFGVRGGQSVDASFQIVVRYAIVYTLIIRFTSAHFLVLTETL